MEGIPVSSCSIGWKNMIEILLVCAASLLLVVALAVPLAMLTGLAEETLHHKH
jgi:hypothetical protein